MQRKGKENKICSCCNTRFFSLWAKVLRSAYLDALKPPPNCIPTVVSGTATFSQQVGNQTVTQSSSKSQNDVTAEREGGFSGPDGTLGGCRQKTGSASVSLSTHTYRASACLPVISSSPRRAMKVSLPQQRKIPAEK